MSSDKSLSTALGTVLSAVDETRMRRRLLALAADPLPCRCLNVTLPGHRENTLYETDRYLTSALTDLGYRLERELVAVQAFQPDPQVPHGFRHPLPTEPWYAAVNIWAVQPGTVFSNKAIVLVAHKDTQSWLDCAPGAHDNAIGVVSLLEIAEVLHKQRLNCALYFLFCNEEHWPWTSEAAAERFARSGREVVAVFNVDSIAGQSAADRQAGQRPHVLRYGTLQGKSLADRIADLNKELELGLETRQVYSDVPNDDDGSFIKAGITPVVLHIGSLPYAEPHYHTCQDRVEEVDLELAAQSTRLILAAVVDCDRAVVIENG
ncbi:M28 family peptidase [candidate division KSB1 bacterium]|nr:M28 family peptidase [candidate division KSB1 bacterium]